MAVNVRTTRPAMSSENPIRDDGTSADDDPFGEYRVLDAELASNLRDGAVVNVNGTQLKIFQANEHVPQMVEVFVAAEEKPVATINTATGETVALGGVDEMLADRVEEIAEMPVEEIPEALGQLAYRLNPAGRDPPEGESEGEESPTCYNCETEDNLHKAVVDGEYTHLCVGCDPSWTDADLPEGEDD
jgi:hypothetical protein